MRPFLKSSFRRSLSFTPNATGLKIHELNSSFSFIWLRDACRSPDSVDPSTRQKLFTTSDIPLDIAPAPNGVQFIQDHLRIEWVDGHVSTFTEAFLRHHSRSNLNSPSSNPDPFPWDASTIPQTPDLFVEYSSIHTPSGLLTAIDQLCRFGIVFIRGVSNKETSHTECELVQLAQRFSEIRETFYGRVWDVINMPNSRNIAYTNLNLGLHMDLLYFQHPPQYQILHCLVNRVKGGQSIFVDALHVADLLESEDFERLSSTPVPFHYENDGHRLYYEHPTIQLCGPQSIKSIRRGIQFINYSPPFQAPLPLSTDHSFYASLGRFAKLLNSPENMFKYTLEEGVAVLFDNRRVLHARTAFTDLQYQLTGPNRWLKGCYIEGDSLWDRGRVLRDRITIEQVP